MEWTLSLKKNPALKSIVAPFEMPVVTDPQHSQCLELIHGVSIKANIPNELMKHD